MNAMEIDINNFRIPELKEAYDNLRVSLGEEIFKQYKAVLKRYFSAQIPKVKFDEDARKLLCIPDQVHMHNLFLLSLTNKIDSNKPNQLPGKKLDSTDYTACPSPQEAQWDGGVNFSRMSGGETCLPDQDLMKGHIYLTSIDHGLEGADDEVAQMIVLAMQVFLKNIVTCMVSYVSGFKIRENNFQHAIGQPVPNPWLRNSSNILDPSQEPNIDVDEDEAAFTPRVRETLDIAEQRTAHAFACTTTRLPPVTRITLRHMYETLLFNPQVINSHSIYSVNLERILSMLDCS